MKLSGLLELIEVETRIKPAWDDPNYLADLLPRLASLYASLGQSIADAERDADLAEGNYKYIREKLATERLEDGVSVAKADKLAVVDSAEHFQEWVKLKHKARLLFLARQSLDRTIEAIRSKLSFLKADRENPHA